ncbi:hypothetical protein WMY93_018385 [Mugilogobius chulae]|uniref:Uncharacterized protein n=1 Tax=Mugilogobius chulae TaxID=88201 RepID=A0AAW0NQK3_9GOBI
MDQVERVAWIYLIYKCLQRRRDRQRRIWVNETLQRRTELAEFHNLLQELRLDEDRFQRYIRLMRAQFDDLLSRIGARITHQDTNYSAPFQLRSACPFAYAFGRHSARGHSICHLTRVCQELTTEAPSGPFLDVVALPQKSASSTTASPGQGSWLKMPRDLVLTVENVPARVGNPASGCGEVREGNMSPPQFHEGYRSKTGTWNVGAAAQGEEPLPDVEEWVSTTHPRRRPRRTSVKREQWHGRMHNNSPSQD